MTILGDAFRVAARADVAQHRNTIMANNPINAKPSIDPADNDACYRLEFDLVRNEAYHRAERQFFRRASLLIEALGVLIIAIAPASLTGLCPSWIGLSASMLLGGAMLLERRMKFERESNYHEEKTAQYFAWRGALNSNRDNRVFVDAIQKQMELEWADSLSNARTLHFAVDAQAYNDAVFRLFPEGAERRHHLLEVMWWEKLAAHVLPFSRERFLRRRDRLADPLGLRILTGILWSAAAGTVIAALVINHEHIGSLPRYASAWIYGGSAVLAFALVDTAYHRLKMAFGL